MPPDPLAPLRSRAWVSEAQRKAIHMATIVLPLAMLYEWPWARGRGEWRLLLIALTLTAIAIDLLRIHERRAREFFRAFFGELIREHEQWSLLGSTYLLIAALLAIEIFPWPVAVAALGFAILEDGLAALVGRAWGRRRFFHKSLEGAAGGLVGGLAWACYLAGMGQLPWPLAVTGALVASLVEFLPIPLDDNLGVTLFSGYVMKMMGGPG